MALKHRWGRTSKVLEAGGPEPKWGGRKPRQPTEVKAQVLHPRAELMHQIMDRAEESLVDHPVKPERFFYLRPSAFPYCGLRKLLSAPKALADGEVAGLAGDYFTRVGTAAHEVFQEHIGRLGDMIGDWHCRHCDRWTRFATFKMCDCGHAPDYKELEIRYKNTVVGHLDGLVRLRERGPQGQRVYLVIDYKTATGSKISKGRTDATVFPYAYNVHQIKRYVVLMELCFNIHVEGWQLIYLNRDVPLGRRNRHIVYHEMLEPEKKELRAELKRWIRLHRLVLVARTYDEFVQVRDQKLCKSARDYADNWASPYQPCPVLPYCFNQEKLEQRIRKMIGTPVFPLINQAHKKLRQGLDLKKVDLPCK